MPYRGFKLPQNRLDFSLNEAKVCVYLYTKLCIGPLRLPTPAVELPNLETKNYFSTLSW